MQAIWTICHLCHGFLGLVDYGADNVEDLVIVNPPVSRTGYSLELLSIFPKRNMLMRFRCRHGLRGPFAQSASRCQDLTAAGYMIHGDVRPMKIRLSTEMWLECTHSEELVAIMIQVQYLAVSTVHSIGIHLGRQFGEALPVSVEI